MKKAVIYARVSTDKQETENQIEQLKTMINQQNCMLIDTYIEIKSGGSSDRPVFQELLKDARIKKFDIVFIWSLDRFSREGIHNTLSYLKFLKDHRISIKSYIEPWLDTTDNAMGELFISIFSWFAQQERIRISERTKTGLINAKNVGKRGKDKKPRNKMGYYKRWVKKGHQNH
jgi:site-specific DNA recombinase